jgi:RNA polymerase sigma-70 factor (ECF subfamily)
MAIPLRDSWLARALEGARQDPYDGARQVQWLNIPRDVHKEDAAPATPDAALLARIRVGEIAAFTELVADVVPALVQYAGRLVHDPASAEDLVQDVLARVWAGRATLAVSTTLRMYVFGAVRHAAFNVRKHDRVVAAHARAVTVTPTIDHDSAEQIEHRLTVEQLLTHLPERRREAVILRYLGALSYAEVAAIMGTTPANAERLVARSLETLRAVLREKPDLSR